MHRHSAIAAVLASALIAAAAMAGPYSIQAVLQPPSVFVGEPAQLQIRVSGGKTDRQPDVACLGADVEFQGAQARSEYVSNNGHQTAFRGALFTYRVTPRQSGRIRIGPISYGEGNKRITVQGPELQARPATSDELASVTFSAMPSNVVVHQPFEFVVQVQLRALPPPHAAESPALPTVPPHLRIPLLDEQPDGLQISDSQELYQKNRATRGNPAFKINDYSIDNSPFPGLGFSSMFDAPATFGLAHTIEGGRHTYELRIPARATSSGTFNIPPVTLSGQIATAVLNGGRPQLSRIQTTSPRTTLIVKEPPLEGRPEGYLGVVSSNMSVKAELDTQTCPVGSPLKLTLTVTGSDTPSMIHTPPLAALIGAARRFRVYDDVVETETLDNGRRFTYTVRPVEAGTLEIPAIPVAYYDYLHARYVTLLTDPLPVRAIPVTQLSANDVLGATEPTATQIDPSAAILARSPALLFPIPSTPTGLTEPVRHLLLLACGPFLFLFILSGRTIAAHTPRHRRARRREQAARHAIARLSDTASPATERTVQAIRSFAADRFMTDTASLTPSDMRQLLTARLPQELATPLADAFETAFNSSFASQGVTDDDGLIERTRELLHAAGRHREGRS